MKFYPYTRVVIVRTDIVIEDVLTDEAMAASGQRPKKATVEGAIG